MDFSSNSINRFVTQFFYAVGDWYAEALIVLAVTFAAALVVGAMVKYLR